MNMAFSYFNSGERRLKELGDKEALRNAIGKASVGAVKQHLIDWNSQHPNRLGGRRTNFISKARYATFYRLTPDGLETYNNALGLALRYYGGTVTPGKNPSSSTGKPTKWLTIPAIPEAYGRRARDFTNLKFFPPRNGRAGALVEMAGGAKNSRTGKRAAGYKKAKSGSVQKNRVFYWLVKSATIAPNRSLMPLVSALEETARLTTTAWVRNIVQAK